MPFRMNEIGFINEYCNAMQPLACALDILQGETNCFIGYLLPTLASLEMKLKPLRPNLKAAAPLVDAILSGVTKRFAGYPDRPELFLASVTLPQFRLGWLDESKRSSCRSLLYTSTLVWCQQHCRKVPNTTPRHQVRLRKTTSFLSLHRMRLLIPTD